MKGDMGEEAFRKVGTYTDEVMAPMGTTGPGKNMQFFGSATSRSSERAAPIPQGGMGPMERSRGPGTLIPEGILASGPKNIGQESLNLNEYLQRMQDTRAAQVGPSNNQLQDTIDATNKRTQPTTTTASSPEQRDTAQKLASTERERDSGGNEALAGAIKELNSKLENLSELKLDTSEITTGLTGVATAVTTLGSKILKVNVENPSLSVEVSNFPTTATEVQPGGADVIKGLTENIKVVTGLQETQRDQLTDHNTRITANLTADGNQNDAIEKLQEVTKAIDPEVIRAQITTETNTAKEAINTAVTKQITDIDGKVVANTTLIGTVKTTADEAKTTADGLETQITTASDNAITAKDTADAAKEVADAAKTVADAATTTATSAKTAADKATEAIATINGVVEDNRNNAGNNVRTVEGNVKTNKDGIKANKDALGQLREDLGTVRGTADSANSRVNAR
jgi:hypothetical protein